MAERARGPLVTAVRRDLAAARAAVRAALVAATVAHTEARTQSEAVRSKAPDRHRALAAERDAVRHAAEEKLARETGTVAAALAELAGQAAPGAAGATWPVWQPSQTGTPTLLRIGSLEFDPPLPALVPLLDAAHLSLTGPDPSTLDGCVAGLLLRMLGCVPAGGVRLWIYDPGRLGGALAGFAPLAGAEIAGGAGPIATFVGPGGLAATLDEFAAHIQRVNSVLAGEYATVAKAAAALGRRPEPWRVLVLLGDPGTELSAAQRAQLDRVTRTGVAAGVHLMVRGVDLEPHPTVRTVTVTEGFLARTGLTGDLTVVLDPPPPAELVTGFGKELAAGRPPATLDSLLPAERWTASAARELRAPIGEGTDGELVELTLGDDPPHALIGGPSGSGKTNLLYCWLAALATRYGPDELELHLLDFKEGVSFARFAPSPRDPSWLPQVRVVGVNVNADREFGLALLRHLAEELKRRAAAAKQHEATKLAELRTEDPQGHWPRIVAVIDEFQVLLGARDQVTTEAVGLLEDLARRGRSQGIHLVLASQDVSGIEALWGRSALVAQFTLRIALPKARRILAEANLAAELIPRHHAVVNADSGAAPANQVVRLPDAGDRARWQAMQEELWGRAGVLAQPPRLFDGDAVPPFPELPSSPPTFAKEGAVALLGETIDVGRRPATLRLTRTPGRNLAVLGTRTEEACAILASAGLALGRQHEPGSAAFAVACLDSDPEPSAKALARELPGCRWITAGDVVPFLASLVDDDSGRPTYVFAYALDAAAPVLGARRGPGEPTGHELLRTLLGRGPERRTHVLGWWRTVARLRDDLGGIGARLDAIGAWIALDVHGNELAPLSPQPGGPVWYPRPQRGLYFDRATHRHPEIVIPYEVNL
ncbi:FtsK/SpoIIIE domain-containing protein [Hamadaea tsunoensis]|uniref:FtsK/SpoIIIE domain-containing protein n=1 Tax=Hamadaea tsunoensis TaxID=53368 RepID=UPI0004820AA1|nr:FtsK/SpoIIIE domain-containing protein [Hamadaea tsunoensis]